jgi:hypothetical protein
MKFSDYRGTDENVERCRAIRKKLAARFKTFEEYFAHLVELDNERIRKERRRGSAQSRRKKAARQQKPRDARSRAKSAR